MVEWLERITRDTDPAIRIEHDARYALAAPLIRDSAVWADLGSGQGVAAADVLGEQSVPRVVLVDVDEDAVQEAARPVPAGQTTALRADLSNPDDLRRVREELAHGTGTITCFETLEHLPGFGPLLEALIELS